jgi:hypothetical protein
MTLGLLYWILMLLWVIFGLWRAYPNLGGAAGPGLILFVLLLIIGWQIFGPPIHK